MERKINTKIPVIFQNLEHFDTKDTRFVKVKIWLMHTGENFNGSYFSKEVVNENLHTLANTPILAFIEENSNGELDFSDHRIVLERENEKTKYVYKGSAIGIIPETNNAKWEKRVTDSGKELEYLTVEGLLWTKWDDPIDIMNRKQFTSQSMELHDDYDGHFDENGIFHFTKFSFFGACLLGDDVLPAMENSTVELVHFSSNNEIKKTIEEKLEEFNNVLVKLSFNAEKGGNTVEKVKSNAQETVETSTKIEQVKEVKENETTVSEENLEAMDTQENFEEQQETTKNIIENKSTETVEEAEFEQTEEKKETISSYDSEGNKVAEIIEKTVENSSVEVEETYSKEFVEQLQSQINQLSSEIEELKAYKLQREKQDLIDKFEGKLTKEEIEEVFASFKDLPIEEVETKLLALYGKKNFSIDKKQTKETGKVQITVNDNKNIVNEPYNGLFSKYLSK